MAGGTAGYGTAAVAVASGAGSGSSSVGSASEESSELFFFFFFFLPRASAGKSFSMLSSELMVLMLGERERSTGLWLELPKKFFSKLPSLTSLTRCRILSISFCCAAFSLSTFLLAGMEGFLEDTFLLNFPSRSVCLT